MKVVISTGMGPLHFIESVGCIANGSFEISIILGWIARRTDTALVRLLSRLSGRDLSAGLRRRQIRPVGYSILSRPIPEFVFQAVNIVSGRFTFLKWVLQEFAWSFYGWYTRSCFKGADIVHIRSGAGQGGAIRYARKRGAKIIVDQSALHPCTCIENTGADYSRWEMPPLITPGKGVWVNVEKDCREADMILVNADQIKSSFVENGYDSSKIRVAYLGVRTDFIGLKKTYRSDGPLRILYTGGFSILKGAEYFLSAIRQLMKDRVSVEVTVIGTVDLPRELIRQYADLPIKYCGRIPQDELKGYLQTSDIYLFPSLADGCAKSGMEAMAAGLCVVATKESGLPIVDGESALIIRRSNAADIVERIKYLNVNRSEIERIGANACKLVATSYTWSAYGEKVRGYYKELLNA